MKCMIPFNICVCLTTSLTTQLNGAITAITHINQIIFITSGMYVP